MESWKQVKLGVCVILCEAILLILFGVFVRYDDIGMPSFQTSSSSHDINGSDSASNALEANAQVTQNYPMFQDIHVMIFIGFGFLMTFLKRYGFSSVGLNFLIAAFVLQWATLTDGWIRHFDYSTKTIHVNVNSIINADFAAATVLISFGAVLGKTSAIQLVVMALFEIVIFQVNEHIVFDIFSVTDVGDSMVVHIFGAYFGLAVAAVVYKKDVHDAEAEEKEGSVYSSDLFAMIGTLFLWVFWPSFNAAVAVDEGKIRAIINTYYSLTASVVVTFAVSSLVTKNKFNMVHIQNATLAGGVAIGSLADLIIEPWGAVLVGMVAGTISVLGYQYLTPFLSSKLRLHDTCGVHNLHGMPGLLSGIGSILAAGLATPERYGDGLEKIFTVAGRTTGQLAGYQAAAVAVSLGFAIVGGVITGFILRLPIWNQPRGRQIFDDRDVWLLPPMTVDNTHLLSNTIAVTTHHGDNGNSSNDGKTNDGSYREEVL